MKLRTLAILALLALPTWGAVTAGSVWELETTGSDSNGGCFDSSNAGGTGVDMTYGGTQATHTFAATLSASATTTLTDSAAGFTNTMLGNCINISGQGMFVITAFTNTSTVTVNATLGTFSGATGIVGGAALTPGFVAGNVAANNTVHQKAGTYPIASTTSNVASGVVNLNVNVITWIGYQTTRLDYGIAPVLQASGISNASLFIVGINSDFIANLVFDGNNLTGITGFRGQAVYGYRLKAMNTKASGLLGNAVTFVCVNCEVTNNTGGTSFVFGVCYGCVSHGNTTTGFAAASNESVCVDCISWGNTVATTDGFLNTSAYALCIGCVSYGNGRDGFRATGGQFGCIGCISEGNTGLGFNFTAAGAQLYYSRYYNNTGGNTSLAAGVQQLNNTSYGATAFTNAAGGDFSLNNNSPGGAELRRAGFPGALLAGGTGYLDLGAFQNPSVTGSVQ